MSLPFDDREYSGGDESRLLKMRDGSAENPSLRFMKSHLSRRGVFSYDEMDIKVLELLRIVYFPSFTTPTIPIAAFVVVLDQRGFV